MKYLPDTNTCIALMRRNARVRGRMESLAPGDCAVSAITALELYHGLERCAQREREQAKIDELFSVIEVLPSETRKRSVRRKRGTRWSRRVMPSGH